MAASRDVEPLDEGCRGLIPLDVPGDDGGAWDAQRSIDVGCFSTGVERSLVQIQSPRYLTATAKDCETPLSMRGFRLSELRTTANASLPGYVSDRPGALMCAPRFRKPL